MDSENKGQNWTNIITNSKNISVITNHTGISYVSTLYIGVQGPSQNYCWQDIIWVMDWGADWILTTVLQNSIKSSKGDKFESSFSQTHYMHQESAIIQIISGQWLSCGGPTVVLVHQWTG